MTTIHHYYTTILIHNQGITCMAQISQDYPNIQYLIIYPPYIPSQSHHNPITYIIFIIYIHHMSYQISDISPRSKMITNLLEPSLACSKPGGVDRPDRGWSDLRDVGLGREHVLYSVCAHVHIYICIRTEYIICIHYTILNIRSNNSIMY